MHSMNHSFATALLVHLVTLRAAADVVPGNATMASRNFGTLSEARAEPTSVQPMRCLSSEFPCAAETATAPAGQVHCVDKVKVCDTVRDCPAAEDEEAGMCRTHTCPSSHFKCRDGFCVPIGKICDYVNDCPDASDEHNCNYRKCWHGEWQCGNRQCINQMFLCDGQTDCKDGSDESDCADTAFLLCDDGKRVHRSFQCDGNADCADQSDERRCGPCRFNQHRCANGRCIPRAHVCDAECDCGGGCDDEPPAECAAFYEGQPGLAFCKKHQTIPCNKTSRCIHAEFLCDGVDDCMDGGTDEFQCRGRRLPSLEATFQCQGTDPRALPPSVRCDHQRHCLGGEDERQGLCQRPPCRPGEYRCRSGQCIPSADVCNSRPDCIDGSDETSCREHHCPAGTFQCRATGQCILQDKVCDHTADCLLDASDEPDTCPYRVVPCPGDHFRCRNGQCIPRQYVCQIGYHAALHGCLDGSHLTECRDTQCDGRTWFKCRGGPCYHSSLQCNGLPDCFKGSRTWTDEEGCPFQCSSARECICVDVTIDCSNAGLEVLPAFVESTITRFILAGNRLNGSRLSKKVFDKLHQMTVLDLTFNDIHTLPAEVFGNLWQLRVLKLAGNQITRIVGKTFSGLANVRVLDISGNGIAVIERHAFHGLSSLPQLDLSQQRLTALPAEAFTGLRSLLSLNLSGNPLRSLHPSAFATLDTVLTSLDISHTLLPWRPDPLTAPHHAVARLRSLVTLQTGDARLCCSLGAAVPHCQPRVDFFSSCSDLMSNAVLRAVLWTMGVVALLANALVIYWRAPDLRRRRLHAFLIINLAVGDLVMGVYLLLIAGADVHYRGSYVYHLHEWKASAACSVVGFLSTVSSELSLFTLLILTLDRLLTILLPFHLKVRLTFGSARAAMLGIWTGVLILALVPLLPVPYFQAFYARSGVCLALHITPQRHPGWEYSLFIFLALNMLVCVLIIVAYCFMYAVTLRTRRAVDQAAGGGRKEARIARRMLLIILTNVACVLPISVLSLLALAEVRVPDEMYSWVAVCLLPINAALNPILYTISTRPFRRTFGARLAYRTRHLRDSLVASLSSTSRHRRASTTTIRSSTTLHRPSLPVTSPGAAGKGISNALHEDGTDLPVRLLRPRRRSTARGNPDARPEVYQRFQQRNHSC
ncbi:G-protein coupled receptor GRL101-like [Paramacrobiotus metropolitanus]|uniref:G-protein coupled receptor GRL101-like n=1 Tax=Paramacrobiotus metropolitanus TaxID=2943436 RepID=UPI002445C843|nr:G-protein coupled receptor GRL101-like [Paramacrobiotus metropolitanus]XP_055343619.1 G-protein coupled receptor GRL101-like [Paramacrobiotus metropolitanus]